MHYESQGIRRPWVFYVFFYWKTSAKTHDCQGNTYMFNIEDPSASPVTFRFRKEMWHVSYHNSPEDIWTHPAVPQKLDGADWFGFGFCRYNSPGKQDSVTLEAWICPPGKDFTKQENWTMLKRIEDYTRQRMGQMMEIPVVEQRIR